MARVDTNVQDEGGDRPRRALVVDDDAFARRLVSDALEGRGYEVISAPDGLAGLRAVAHELLALDLLVTDVAMPALDGEALVRRIRGVGGELDLAIVVVSGSPAANAERLRAAGADTVLGKELGPDAIAAAADAASRVRAVDRRTLAAA